MATIQIRELPEATYETIRRRARADGQSIQAYMRDRVVEMASAPTKAEAIDAIEHALAEHDAKAVTPAAIAAHVQAERR